MTLARDSLRWNGWGRPGEAIALAPAREAALLAELERQLGQRPERPPPPVALEEVRLAPSKLAAPVLERLRRACGDAGVRTDAATRVRFALGRSLPDLLRLRRGEIDAAPDAVVSPRDEAQVQAVVRVAVDADVAVVPFGGGTSVVGGVDPLTRPGQAACLALDLAQLDAVLGIDARSGLATVQAGIDGPSLERALRDQDLTLGHYPQSFEYSTLGGWIATRSTGQQSNGYGGIERLVAAVRVVTPQGVLETRAVPRSAAGPDWNALVLGSEGTLGVVVSATLRAVPAPARQEGRGLLFRSFAQGVEAAREMTRSSEGPGLLRLSDAAETQLGRVQRRDPERRLDLAEGALALLGRLGWGGTPCAMLVIDEGEPARVRARLHRARAAGRAHGAAPLGRSPARHWRRDRFRTPYWRDWLLDRGVGVDTFETAVPWSRVERAHERVSAALEASARAHAGGGLAMAHLSHSYPDGACLYFTLMWPLAPDDPVAQWRALKRDATESVLAAGGTLSHHHGVGRDHAPWLEREIGPLARGALHALKARLDPRGVMNPGKLA